MEPYRKDPGRYYAQKIFRDDPDRDDDDFHLRRPSSKPQPSAPPFGNRKDQTYFEPSSSASIIGSPSSQRRTSEYHFGPRAPSGLKDVTDMMQFVSTYAIESAGRRRTELDLVPSASMGVKYSGEKRASSGYEVACDMRRREYEVGPNNKVVKIIDTDINFRVTHLEEPNKIKGKLSLYNTAPSSERAHTRTNYSSSSSSSGTSGRSTRSTSTTPRLVTATCPFCCRKDEFERRYLNGTVTCERCLRNFFLEEDRK